MNHGRVLSYGKFTQPITEISNKNILFILVPPLEKAGNFTVSKIYIEYQWNLHPVQFELSIYKVSVMYSGLKKCIIYS